ncbi:hypothetical protein HK102_011893, partial [Quaeritorhiza haematococci]
MNALQTPKYLFLAVFFGILGLGMAGGPGGAPLGRPPADRVTVFTEHQTSNKACSNPSKRREWRNLNAEEQQTYINAFNALRKPGTSRQGNANRLEDYVNTHIQEYAWAHNVETFLSWHRVFIRTFELELQKSNPSITLPYWNWAADSALPHESPILDTFGGDGDSNASYCVQDGSFGSVPDACFTRSFNGPNHTLTPFPNELIIANIIMNRRDFLSFRTNIEVEHNMIHNNLGGDRGDISSERSPRDPLFWL